MKTMIALLTENFAAQALPLLVKATFLLAAAGAAAMLLRRRSAALRHAVWTLCAAGLLAVPLLGAAVPALKVSVPSRAAAATAAAAVEGGAPGRAVLQDGAAPSLMGRSIPPGTQERREAGFSMERLVAESGAVGMPGTENLAIAIPLKTETRGEGSISGWSWRLAALFWISGAGLCLAVLLIIHAGLWRFAAATRVVPVGGTLERLLAEARGEMGIRQPVVLSIAGRPVIPFACGLFRQRIVLPVEAETWPEDRVRLVLLHELAHIRRRDCLTQLLAQLACAFYWFHPLAWWMAWRMRVERENACDDAVINAGASPGAYGKALLAIVAANIPGARVPFAALAMARPSRIETRLKSILNSGLDRRNVQGRALLVWMVPAALLLLALGSVQLTAREGQQPSSASVPGTPASAPAAPAPPQTQTVSRDANPPGAPVVSEALPPPPAGLDGKVAEWRRFGSDFERRALRNLGIALDLLEAGRTVAAMRILDTVSESISTLDEAMPPDPAESAAMMREMVHLIFIMTTSEAVGDLLKEEDVESAKVVLKSFLQEQARASEPASAPPVRPAAIVGRWREAGTTTVAAFHEDGTVELAADMPGGRREVSGKYSFITDGKLKLELRGRGDGPGPGPVVYQFTLSGDQLILVDVNGDKTYYSRAR